ncbi:hypothetical protein B0J17DRAFT_771924 [Rhizoctonia solani]|nr:hypothetical protein B0J17DRAFT_771924 [Rhizoctonia solani]
MENANSAATGFKEPPSQFRDLAAAGTDIHEGVESASLHFIDTALGNISGVASDLHNWGFRAEMLNTPSESTLSETVNAPQSTCSTVQPSHGSSEAMLMFVVPGLNTRGCIRKFVRQYTSNLPKSVRVVLCSRCLDGSNPNRNREIKPSNLTPHIMAHNGVKLVQCPISECGGLQFTTKDQGKKHLEGHYKGIPVERLIELGLDLEFPAQDT